MAICPRCGGTVPLVHREKLYPVPGEIQGVTAYVCPNTGCGAILGFPIDPDDIAATVAQAVARAIGRRQ
jgi:hypothetical protein